MAAHENSLTAGRGITEYQGLCCTCALGVEKNTKARRWAARLMGGGNTERGGKKTPRAALGRSVLSKEEH
jgi:hypothetical protein